MSRRAAGQLSAAWLGCAMTLGVGLVAADSVTAQSNVMQRLQYGEVLSAQAVVIQDRPSGRGAAAGSTVGAIAGAAIARRGDGLLGALVGGAIGGAIGRAADRAGSTKRGTELTIRLASGDEVAIQLAGEQQYYAGDRVRLTSGPRGTQVQRVQRE
jgi:outer membrane lipoprotein SlyB